MIKFPKDKASELKQMINEGLHVFGRAMSIAEQMCEGADYGDRYGDRYEEHSHYPNRPPYDDEPYMGERRGVRGTGRYSNF